MHERKNKMDLFHYRFKNRKYCELYLSTFNSFRIVQIDKETTGIKIYYRPRS